MYSQKNVFACRDLSIRVSSVFEMKIIIKKESKVKESRIHERNSFFVSGECLSFSKYP